jgi:hypothetical protein
MDAVASLFLPIELPEQSFELGELGIAPSVGAGVEGSGLQLD